MFYQPSVDRSRTEREFAPTGQVRTADSRRPVRFVRRKRADRSGPYGESAPTGRVRTHPDGMGQKPRARIIGARLAFSNGG
jgi:hypothetical protein